MQSHCVDRSRPPWLSSMAPRMRHDGVGGDAKRQKRLERKRGPSATLGIFAVTADSPPSEDRIWLPGWLGGGGSDGRVCLRRVVVWCATVVVPSPVQWCAVRWALPPPG